MKNIKLGLEADGKLINFELNENAAVKLYQYLKVQLGIGHATEEYRAEIPRPGREIFEEESMSVTEHLLKAPQPVFVMDRVEYPDDGGIFVHLKGLKYPTKGFPTPEACQANNLVKRVFIGQIRYLAKNPIGALPLLTKRGRELWLDIFTSFAEIALGQFYLKDIRYNKTCREIRKFTEVFLQGLGISEQRAKSFALTLATMFEYDNAYLFRFQDLANETSSELLRENPRREFNKLFRLLKERDERLGMHIRFESIIKLLSWGLYLPKIRKAFNKAIGVVNFSNMQMDDNDKYQVLRWTGYDFLGRTFEDRAGEFLRVHNGEPPKAYIMQS